MTVAAARRVARRAAGKAEFVLEVVFGRIQSLATKTSEQASAPLHLANAQVTAFTAQMEARRKAAAR